MGREHRSRKKLALEMKIALDTNVLVRAAVRDDPKQTDAATRLMSRASDASHRTPVAVRICLGFAQRLPPSVSGYRQGHPYRGWRQRMSK